MKDKTIILYDKNNSKRTFENFKYYNEGSCARVFKKENILMKIYKSDCTYNYYLSKKLFSLLQELDIPNIVKLYDYFHINHDRISQILPMDAYTMEYVSNSNITLINQSKEYILKMINNMEKTCNILARNKIEIRDLHAGNIVFNKEGATLVDVDLYSIMKLKSIKKILLYNQYVVFSLIKDKICTELKNANLNINPYQIYNLFDIDLNYQSLFEKIDKFCTEDSLMNSIKNI